MRGVLMGGIGESQVTQLEAFDKNGAHCGFARWSPYKDDSRTWLCASGNQQAWLRSQAEAERWLRERGAVTIQESDGRK
jgi:hypothetical protein